MNLKVKATIRKFENNNGRCLEILEQLSEGNLINVVRAAIYSMVNFITIIDVIIYSEYPVVIISSEDQTTDLTFSVTTPEDLNINPISTTSTLSLTGKSGQLSVFLDMNLDPTRISKRRLPHDIYVITYILFYM